jgi:GAF domain-containing protein
MVARIGGISIFNQLLRDEKWTALEAREPNFKRFRELALRQKLNTVAGISLQAKERVFGLLLLGDTETRRFAPAELRLLLALGHQIGMAVENSYLIQQTARRTEELHIMNEIGRALSSTLDLEALFDKIYAEIDRLFEVTSFYIAFYDPQRQVIEFRMEVAAGQRVPERSRAAGNHLTEYIIRTQQPILVRENYVDEVRRLGCEPIQQFGSFCGVPLLLHDRSIGVMAVHSSQDRAFDEGHLELMRVLASEASIAIENARLFSEQQERNRHLALLNDISRHAIMTLNPDEVLSNIAQELETGLTYDHIGIGLLDYTAKEVVVQVEAGRRKESSALGLRIPFGEKLIGHVARTGEPSTAAEMAAARSNGNLASELTAVPDAQSGIALPMVYGEQLQGVFFVEMASPYSFSVAEIRLLRTLADLISSALHNAISYHKAQEQAITDGLTNVKTHRYFMEALSAEWKRATRAGRSFSLVLIDLDRFKYVNDFYGHLEGDVVLQRVAELLEQS